MRRGKQGLVGIQHKVG